MNRTLRWAGSACLSLTTLTGIQAQSFPNGPAPRRLESADATTAGARVYYIRKPAADTPPPDDAALEQAEQAARAQQEALTGRHRALEQFRLGNEALRQGRTRDAEAHFAPLQSNTHLSLQERQQVARISVQLRQKETRRDDAMNRSPVSATPSADPDALLTNGRRALAQKDYDRAEALGRQAQQLGHSATWLWSDTPAKLLKDVQAQRTRDQVLTGANAGRASPPPPVQPALRPQDTPRVAGPAPQQLKNEADGQADRRAKVLLTLQQAHAAAQSGDLPRARQLVKEAEAQRVPLPWWEDFTPEKVRLEITRAELVERNRAAGAALTAKSQEPAEKPLAAPALQSPHQDARALVGEARMSFEAGRYDQAAQLARQEIADRQYAHPKPQLPPLLEPVKPSATAVKAPPRPTLEPSRPESEIIASSPPRPGRSHAKLEMMPSPSARPARPGDDAVARSDVSRENAPNERPEPEKTRQDTFAPLPPAPDIFGTDAAARPGAGRTASQHLAEVRRQQKEGLLLEALTSFEQAKACAAAQGPAADAPESQLALVFADLRKDATAQALAFSSAVNTLMARGYYQDAERYLKYVQQLCAAFQIDPRTLPEAAVRMPPTRPEPGVVQAADHGSQTGDERGAELVVQSMQELRSGNFARARHLAEELYMGPYHLKGHARDLLSRIDDAEAPRTPH